MAVRLSWPDTYTLRIRGARDAADDLTPIMPELERLVRQDNREGLLMGLDRNGRPFRKLSKQTIKYRRSATGPADPNAPPLIPAREKSRAIANYRTTSGRLPDGNWTIIGGWLNFLSPRTRKGKGGDPIMLFHIDGTRFMPQRDAAGVRPAGRAAVGSYLRTWLRERWSRP